MSFLYRTVREIRQYISLPAYELTINESDFNLNSVLDEAIIQKNSFLKFMVVEEK